MIKFGWVELEKTKAVEEEKEEERRWQHHSAHFAVFQKITTFEPNRIFKRGQRHRLALFQQIIWADSRERSSIGSAVRRVRKSVL